MSDSLNFKRQMQLVCAMLFGLAIGCEPMRHNSFPPPLKDSAERVLEGHVGRIWGGDNFEIREEMELHYILIRGVDTPKVGQDYYDEAFQLFTKSVRGQKTRVEIVGRDELMREFADVFVLPKKESDLRKDMGLELIKAGLGWYDGMEFDKAKEYREAEKQAREKKIGLWADPNPVPPWDFEEEL